MDISDKITEHFTYGEVIHSNLAKGVGMNNDLPNELLPAITLVANMLEEIRVYFARPIKILSWYRNPVLNEMVGSQPTSQHIKGEAVDFIIPGIPNLEVARYIRDSLVFDQLILERTWIHCSLVDKDNRKEVLTTIDGKIFKKGLK